METTKIGAFAKANKIEHIIGDVSYNTSKNGEVFGEYAYVRVEKTLYIKYFSKFDNFVFVLGDTIHSEFKKDGSINQVFNATLKKLQTAKAVKQDLSMF